MTYTKVNELVINCNIMIALVYGSYNVLRREFNIMGLLMLCHVTQENSSSVVVSPHLIMHPSSSSLCYISAGHMHDIGPMRSML